MKQKEPYKLPIGIHEDANLLKIGSRFGAIWITLSLIFITLVGLSQKYLGIKEIYFPIKIEKLNQRIIDIGSYDMFSVYFYVSSLYAFLIFTPIVSSFMLYNYYLFVIKPGNFKHISESEFFVTLFYIFLGAISVYLILFYEIDISEFRSIRMSFIFLFPFNILMGTGAILMASVSIILIVCAFWKLSIQYRMWRS